MTRRPGRTPRLTVISACALLALGGALPLVAEEAPTPPIALLALGDSLSHGTLDATNNGINTANSYVQRVYESLRLRAPIAFRQPFFDLDENRITPRQVPTNLAVDGADSFTVEGLDYYKRAGTTESLPSLSLISEKIFASQLDDKYDKVIYPLNVLAGRPLTQIGAAEWLLREGLPAAGVNRAITLYWVGNNDSSSSALGFGGANPTFLPLPAEQLIFALPGISVLLQLGEAAGEVSTEPYSLASIDRNLTELGDYLDQNWHLLDRLTAAGHASGVDNDIFVITLPYYSAVGYLFDSEDIEYYLEKVNPAYRVPASFARVAPRGQPITDPLQGDRISLLTFGIMYALLETGHPVAFVNRVLERDGQQRDGLVLSEAEAGYIRTRIDGFNARLRYLADDAGPNVHLVDLGPFLSAVLGGQIPVTIGGFEISRKWIRGSSFSFDGVHPNYAGHALAANYVIDHINAVLGLSAPLTPLDSVIATDPYVDRDGDGWAPGPAYEAGGLSEVLFLFKDPDDTDPTVQVDLPDNVWEVIRDALLGDLLRAAPALRPEAERLGLVASAP